MKEPRIRFKEFGDGIKSRKLANLAKFSKGKGYSKSSLRKQGTPIILYGNMYTNYEAIITDSNHFVDGSANDKVSKFGDVIVPASGETAIDISRASAILSNGIILGGDLNVISPNNGINGEFLAYYLSFGNRKYKIARLAQGKTIVHIHNSDLEKLEINYPDVKEQNKIVNYFYDLDKLIKMQSDKLEHLKRDKKGYLQKMFPNEDGKNPKLRFRDFNNDWNYQKISTLVTFNNGGPFKSEHFMKTGIPIIRISNILNNGRIGGKFTFYKKNKKFNKYLISENSILIAMSGATVGKIAMIKTNENFYQNQRVGYFKSKRNTDNDFLFSFLNSNGMYKQLKKIRVSGAQPNISSNDINSFFINYPSLPEQQKIGQFFSHLDHLIDLQQQKINHLKQLKKAYLQKMFV